MIQYPLYGNDDVIQNGRCDLEKFHCTLSVKSSQELLSQSPAPVTTLAQATQQDQGNLPHLHTWGLPNNTEETLTH